MTALHLSTRHHCLPRHCCWIPTAVIVRTVLRRSSANPPEQHHQGGEGSHPPSFFVVVLVIFVIVEGMMVIDALSPPQSLLRHPTIAVMAHYGTVCQIIASRILGQGFKALRWRIASRILGLGFESHMSIHEPFGQLFGESHSIHLECMPKTTRPSRNRTPGIGPY
jgi:hypothetical protein